MSRYSPKIRKDIIEAILTAQHAHSCAFHIETVSESSPEEPPTHDYATASGVDNENTITAGADKRYAIGSGMKLMINVALYRMMEDGKTVLKDDKVRGMMRSAWDTPAFPLYNELRRYRGLSEWTQPWKPNPTVIQLMRHTHAFLAHQRGLVGPDGRFLMSEETFGQTFAALVNSTSSTQVGEFCYSNWNAMLLGFIIKHAYAKDAPLADALKCIVLDFANMTNTILDRATFEQNKGRIARPNISTAVSESHESDFLDFLDDDAALAVGGGFSCVEDMAKLLKFMLKARLDGDEMMKRKFFSSTDTFADKSLGIARLPLECTLLWIPPQLVQSHSSGFQDQIRIYTTSSDAALASRFQRSLRQEPLVIAVMTNTSGIADPSQMVAQYLIQEILRLSPRMDPFEEKASQIYTGNRDILRREATCHRAHLGFSSEEQEKLQGCYIEAITQQRLFIQESNDYELSAYIREGCGHQPRRTSEMQLIKIAKDTIALSPLRQELAVDAYHAWRSFALEIKTRNDGKVYALVKATGLPILGQSDNRQSTFNECYERRDM